MTKDMKIENKKQQSENWIKKVIEKINDRKILILSVLFVVCFIMGIWGFYREWDLPPEAQNEPTDFLNAAYLTLTLFALNFSDPVNDWVLNLARFGASIFTVGGLLIVFGQGVKFIWNYLNGRVREDSVFVFGENEDAKYLVETIGSAAVTSPKSILKAKAYVLMGSDEENLKFYYDNREQMGENPVFIKSNVFGRIMVTGEIDASKNDKRYNHTFFSTDEIVAKTYWKENHLLKLAEDHNYRLNVAIVGFNALGEELLFQALQMNIFDVEQEITYHLWPESQFSNQAVDIEEEYLACFEATHSNLEELNVVVHHEPWYKACDQLKAMNRIIISDYQNAIPLVQKILQILFLNNTELDVFYRGQIDEKLMADHRYGKVNSKNIRLFNYLSIGCDWAAIKNDKVIELAKRLNWEWNYIYVYMSLYKDKLNQKKGHVETNEEAALENLIKRAENLGLSVDEYQFFVQKDIAEYEICFADFLKKKEAEGDVETQWRKLSAEKRQSNYSSALYQVVREDIVKFKEAKKGIKDPTFDNWEEYVHSLKVLEHMRWCNFYWFLNWHFAELSVVNENYNEKSDPILESRKKASERLHNDLQAYDDLFPFVQNVDELQVRIGFGQSCLMNTNTKRIIHQAFDDLSDHNLEKSIR